MAERDYGTKIVTYITSRSGDKDRIVIDCKGPKFMCLKQEVWSGEGINEVAGRLLRTEAGIAIPPGSEINASFERKCKWCRLKNTPS